MLAEKNSRKRMSARSPAANAGRTHVGLGADLLHRSGDDRHGTDVRAAHYELAYPLGVGDRPNIADCRPANCRQRHAEGVQQCDRGPGLDGVHPSRHPIGRSIRMERTAMIAFATPAFPAGVACRTDLMPTMPRRCTGIPLATLRAATG